LEVFKIFNIEFLAFFNLKIKKMKQIIIVVTVWLFANNVFAQNFNCQYSESIFDEHLDSENFNIVNDFTFFTGTLKQNARVNVVAGKYIFIDHGGAGFFEADSGNGSVFLAYTKPVNCNEYEIEAEALVDCNNISRTVMHEEYGGENKKKPVPNLSGVEYSDLAYYPEENMLFMPLDDAITNVPNNTQFTTGAERHAIRAYDIDDNLEYDIKLTNMPSDFVLHEADDNVNPDADFEGLTYLRDGYFALIDEVTRLIYFLEYDDFNKELSYISSFDISAATAASVASGLGIEGISYNPNNNHLYCITEGFGIGTFSNPDIVIFEFEIASNNDFSNVNLIQKNKLNLSQKLKRTDHSQFKDAAGIYHLGQMFPASNQASNRLLVISQESKKIMEVDMTGYIYGSLMNVSNEFQPEGVAFIPINNTPQIVVSSEGQKLKVRSGVIKDQAITAKISNYTNACAAPVSPKLTQRSATIAISPNPSINQSVISYELANDAKVSLYITDILGKQITTLVDGEQQQAGINEIMFDTSTLPTGVYFCTMQANNKVNTQKLMKANY